MNAPAPISPQTASAGKTLRSARELAEAGLMSAQQAQEAGGVEARYAVAVTDHVAKLINPADPRDPLARQYLPDAAELQRARHERDDPIGDAAHAPVAGIVHRYPDRVLLKLLTLCPVYCRFCFRRESVGGAQAQILGAKELDAAFAYIESHPAIWEVILTGGDPLALSARRLEAVMKRLAAIAHVKTIRIHSRVPVAEPARITSHLIAALGTAAKPVWIAIHANHPRELEASAARTAIAMLADAGLPLVSQSVLLKGVNDDADTLAALMRSFVENRIKPYYLHHPDLAPGTGHFRVPFRRGRELVRGLRGRVSGLAIPHYVLDIPGGAGKSPVTAEYLRDEHASSIQDWQGNWHDYRDEDRDENRDD
ncbi:MAG: lysine-2,3-aminomutase-like protein [Alphaproteobacteria bacterium]|nr:lysine-2,3-aminomutase-like protein [Alphaproteobacteria bacterium]